MCRKGDFDMEIRDASELRKTSAPGGEGATLTPLHPVQGSDGLVSVDLWVIEAGGSVSTHKHGEEHVIFVISGMIEVSGGSTTSVVREGGVVYTSSAEAHGIRNKGNEQARLLVSTPLLVRSDRSVSGGSTSTSFWTGSTLKPEDLNAEQSADRPPARIREQPSAQPPAQAMSRQNEEESPPDISGLMKRGSDLVGVQRPERRKPPAPPVEEQEPDAVDDEVDAEEQDAQSNLMELFVAFEGGIRDKPPGQGFGSFMVQAPGRKPVIKRVEFGDNYTTQQSEYAALIACVEYIIERLAATGRGPEQVQLDIRSDSSAVVNQLLGNERVKDAALRKRLDQAVELLSGFADWRIEWHDKSESARLLGG
jgi:quercetin dioxygenase-like cupin family protein/ribonuclease HI